MKTAVPNLRETQEWMADLVRRPRALPTDALVSEAARIHVAGNDRLTASQQLEIYREQFWLRHTASLLEDFPGLSGILGQKIWEELVESYLGAVAPASWSLRNLGYRLPAHVELATWLPHPELCTDMARLEWAYVELFDAPDVPSLDPARLAAVPDAAWDTAELVLSPAMAVLRVAYSVEDLRRAFEEQRTDGAALLPDRAPRNLVLYRGADRNLYHSVISDAARELLVALGEGLPLGRACERAAERIPREAAELERDVGEWFSDFARRGWVVNVETR
jgi:hypothetical protein